MEAWLDRDNPHRWEILRCMWELGSQLSRYFPHPRGVFKFRSIEEMNAFDDQWERQRTDFLLALKEEDDADF